MISLEDINLEIPPDFCGLGLELTNACGYKCYFCPRSKMTRPVGFLSDEDIDIIAERLAELGIKDDGLVVHLNGFGEPLLIKTLPQKIKYIKNLLPNSYFAFTSTLGVNVSEEYLEELILSGLCEVHVSFYGYNPEDYKNIHGSDNFTVAYNNLFKLVELNEKHDNKLRIIVIIEDFREKEGNNCSKDKELFLKKLKKNGKTEVFKTKLHNYAGAKNYIENVNSFPCSIIWGHNRKMLNITWDLNVIPCFMMYDDNLVIGNIREQSVNEIFSGEKYKHFAESLLNRELENYPFCRDCQKVYLGSEEEVYNIEKIMNEKVPLTDSHKADYKKNGLLCKIKNFIRKNFK